MANIKSKTEVTDLSTGGPYHLYGVNASDEDVYFSADDLLALQHDHAISDVTGLQTALDNKIDDSQASAFGLTMLGTANAAAGRAALELGTVALLDVDTDDTLAADSDDVVPSQQAVKAYVDGVAASAASAASASEIWTGSETAKYVSPDKLFDAAVPQALSDAATVAVDMAAGINFNVTLGGNRTLGNPTNAKPGQSGRIRVTQDATGSRTLAYEANWKHVGEAPTLATAAGAVDLFAYFVNTSSDIELSYLGTLA